MKARFKTNLDLAQPYLRYLNDDDLDSRDFQNGDRVEFNNHDGSRSFQLQVVGRTVAVFDNPFRETYMLIELHFPNYETRSIREWEEWFKQHMGR
jgi:hypothetical protein